MKKRVFVDMDGTLAVWNAEAKMDEVASTGYMLNRPTMENMVAAIRQLTQSKDYEVCILSAVFHEAAAHEKKQWLNIYLPEIKPENMFFCNYGENKSEFVSATDNDVLIDDFSENLHKWKGIGIKVYNGINGTNGSWTGYSVHSNCESRKLHAMLNAIIRLEVQ